jgi:hypothetical protein
MLGLTVILVLFILGLAFLVIIPKLLELAVSVVFGSVWAVLSLVGTTVLLISVMFAASIVLCSLA